jgi:cell division protease FtsH
VTYPPGKDGQKVIRFRTYRPSFTEDTLFQLLSDKGVEVSARPPPGPSFLERLLIGFGPTLLLGLFAMTARRGAMGVGGFGRSRAKRYEPEAGRRVTFADVAGIDDVEEEVAEIVDFLRNRTVTAGSVPRCPRVSCCPGHRGRGRRCWPVRWLARPTCRFIRYRPRSSSRWSSASEPAASGDLFEQAKKDAPAIIFIDELDAVDRARGGAMSIGRSSTSTSATSLWPPTSASTR